MFVRTVLWDLEGSPMTIASLQEYLRDTAHLWEAVPGLRYKVWIADEQANTWGAIFLWESREACATAGPLPSRAKALIGKDPVTTDYEVEATVEGAYTDATLAGGRAFA